MTSQPTEESILIKKAQAVGKSFLIVSIWLPLIALFPTRCLLKAALVSLPLWVMGSSLIRHCLHQEVESAPCFLTYGPAFQKKRGQSPRDAP